MCVAIAIASTAIAICISITIANAIMDAIAKGFNLEQLLGAAGMLTAPPT